MSENSKHAGTISRSAIEARIQAISEIAEQRIAQASDEFVGLMGGAGIVFLDAQERAELHHLKMLLPTCAQLRQEAKARLSNPNRVRGIRILKPNPQRLPDLEAGRISR